MEDVRQTGRTNENNITRYWFYHLHDMPFTPEWMYQQSCSRVLYKNGGGEIFGKFR